LLAIGCVAVVKLKLRFFPIRGIHLNAAAPRQIASKLTPTRSSSEPDCAASIQAMFYGDYTFAIPSELKNHHSSSPVINISKHY
jgi:hypothetical protein